MFNIYHMMSSSTRDIQVHRGLLVIIQASRCCPVSSTLSTPRYKVPPAGRTLVMVHFCPVHFWTVSSKPNSLSLLSTSSRHRFDFLFCMEPLWGGEKREEKKDLFHSSFFGTAPFHFRFIWKSQHVSMLQDHKRCSEHHF